MYITDLVLQSSGQYGHSVCEEREVAFYGRLAAVGSNTQGTALWQGRERTYSRVDSSPDSWKPGDEVPLSSRVVAWPLSTIRIYQYSEACL